MGRRTRLHVNVSTPDGGIPASRGLAGWLEGIAPARARGDVTVAIVSDRRMRVLNRTFRGKDYATDVLAFAVGSREPGVALRDPQRDPELRRRGGSRNAVPRSLGDIVIAAGVAARQAREHGHATGVEFKVLALHGLLHLIGYDHEDPVDQGRMARAEGRLRARAGLPSGLIARARRRTTDSRLPTSDSRRRS
jgi:probable rRNA maturation factor